MKLPLAGIRVLDLSQGWAGPTTTYLLGDLGAEIVKVESIQRVDWWRIMGQNPEDPKFWERRGAWNNVNRNKYDVTLDLTTPEGAALIRDMVRISDVFVENFSVRVMRRFGLTYPELTKLNPSIIALSMPAFGSTGPWQEYLGFGTNVEQTSGLSWQTSYEDGYPLGSGVGLADPIAGYNGVLAVLLAVYHRRRTGRGQFIDLSHIEASGRLIGEKLVDASINHKVRPQWGNDHPSQTPHGVYRCQGEDAWVVIAVGTQEEWEALCRVLGMPELASDPRFSDPLGRRKHREELDRCIEEWTSRRDKREVMEQMQKAGVPCGAVSSPKDLVEDPHIQARDFMVSLERKEVGTFKTFGVHVHLSKTPGTIRRPPPSLGEHNEFILGELLGVPSEEQQRMEAAQITGHQPLGLL
ncbi:MAG: CoA transferase [Chloroflexi bacterium]|nr:CoA transferase [Chloroflexota bacterium]